MSSVDLLRPRRHLLAWSVPVVVVAAVAGGFALASATSASGHPSLPALSPAQLLAKVETARAPALSGVVQETARLGLPSLPGGDESASLSWTSLISGTHTAKVWLDGLDKQRVALQGTLSEADVIHNGADVWTYTSGSNTVSHSVLPADGAGPNEKDRAGEYTPIGAARAALKAITPSTSVGVGQTQVVAGRKAYTLAISPRDRRSTVRLVTIAIDSKRFVPLQLSVFGTGSSPAFEIGFTDIAFATPKASTFDFHAPAGATVTANPLQDQRMSHHVESRPGGAAPGRNSAPKLLGSGWTTVVELPDGLPVGASGGLLDRFTTSTGTPGERLLSTALLNGVLLPDGRVFVGAVSPRFLEHIAATTPR